MDCPNLGGCPFFNDRMANMPSMSNMMKHQYCQGDFAACARRQVCNALGMEKVPGDLFPYQYDRVKALLA